MSSFILLLPLFGLVSLAHAIGTPSDIDPERRCHCAVNVIGSWVLPYPGWVDRHPEFLPLLLSL
jgi:hypothetical protein